MNNALEGAVNDFINAVKKRPEVSKFMTEMIESARNPTTESQKKLQNPPPEWTALVIEAGKIANSMGMELNFGGNKPDMGWILKIGTHSYLIHSFE